MATILPVLFFGMVATFVGFQISDIKNFILQLVPEPERTEGAKVILGAQKVARQYLAGMAFMIVCLWVLYGIGFSLVGIRNPLFFAVLRGLLEIVPFVGNLTGTLLTVLMSLMQGGGIWMVTGIIAVYGLVQFIQTYFLETLVVGAEVNINPLATITGLVAGEALWGISGMVLAIPLLGIIKIICDHVKVLHPYGYLLGQDKKDEERNWEEAEETRRKEVRLITYRIPSFFTLTCST